MFLYFHNVHSGINPPEKKPLFFAKLSLNLQTVQAPLFIVFLKPPPPVKKITFFSEPPYIILP